MNQGTESHQKVTQLEVSEYTEVLATNSKNNLLGQEL